VALSEPPPTCAAYRVVRQLLRRAGPVAIPVLVQAGRVCGVVHTAAAGAASSAVRTVFRALPVMEWPLRNWPTGSGPGMMRSKTHTWIDVIGPGHIGCAGPLLYRCAAMTSMSFHLEGQPAATTADYAGPRHGSPAAVDRVVCARTCCQDAWPYRRPPEHVSSKRNGICDKIRSHTGRAAR
jgi:hypothetical protein